MASQRPPEAHWQPPAEADQSLEMAIGMMLRVGVSVAAAVILIGGILYLSHPGAAAPDYRRFHAAPAEALSIHGTFAGVARGSSLSIIQLGVLLLIATPVVRVVFALVGFVREGDRLYAWVSAVVLAILVFSLLHSR
jgi:uncharacterized membrane protein